MEKKKITDKIDKLFTKKPELSMCYVTSDIMYKSLKSEPNEIKFYNTYNFYNFMMKYKTYNIELTLTSKKIFNDGEKNKLIKQFEIDRTGYANSVFKYDKLRIFMHAFNIFKLKKGYLWAQSWFNVQTYGIRKEFATSQEYSVHIIQLIHAINNFNNNPSELYAICFYGKEIDDNTKKILKMVREKKIQYDVSIKCNY